LAQQLLDAPGFQCGQFAVVTRFDQLGFGDTHFGEGVVAILRRDEILLVQLIAPAMLVARVMQTRFGRLDLTFHDRAIARRSQRRLLNAGIKLDQNLSLADQTAAFDMNAVDQRFHRAAYFDALVRLDQALILAARRCADTGSNS
jgi:hypothetical protein